MNSANLSSSPVFSFMLHYSITRIFYSRRRFLYASAVLAMLSLFVHCGSEFKILLDKPLPAGKYRGIYWTESSGNTINRINFDRTGKTVLLNLTGKPLDIALYIPGGHMFWTEDTGSVFQIGRSNLDGTAPDIFHKYSYNPNHGPTSIAIDQDGGYIYWNQYQQVSNHHDLFRSDINVLPALQVKWIDTIPYPYTYSIALDAVNRKIYVAACSDWDLIYQTSPDGGALYQGELDTANTYSARLSDTGSGTPYQGIAVDPYAGYAYFVTGKTLIMRSGLDLQGSVPWVTAAGFDIDKISLDLTERKIYWTSPASNCLYRGDLDYPDSGVEQFLQLDNTPTGMAIVP